MKRYDLSIVPLHKLCEATFCMHELSGLGQALRAAKREEFDVKLGDVMADAWNGQIDEALQNALSVLLTDPGAVMTDSLLQDTLKQAGIAFDGVADSIEQDVGGILGDAFMSGRESVLKPLGMSFVEQLVDGEAQSALEADSMFWVGSYFDRSVGAQISDIINSTVIQKGGSREDAGAALEAALGGDFPDKTASYWHLVGAAGAQRATVFGGISSMKQAKVKTVRFVNPNDYRTSDICEHLVQIGIFPAKYVYEDFDEFLDADSPEEAKAASPWPDAKLVLATSSPDALGRIGIVPPLHGYCRSDLVPDSFYDKDEEADVGRVGGEKGDKDEDDAEDADGNTAEDPDDDADGNERAARVRSAYRIARRRQRPKIWLPR